MGDAMRYLGVLARRRRLPAAILRRRRWRPSRREGAADEDHSGPKKKTAESKAKFKFKSDESGSSFECKLDRKRFESCDSSHTYRRLEPGRHRFEVRATDLAGNTDPTPAKYRWRYEPRR